MYFLPNFFNDDKMFLFLPSPKLLEITLIITRLEDTILKQNCIICSLCPHDSSPRVNSVISIQYWSPSAKQPCEFLLNMTVFLRCTKKYILKRNDISFMFRQCLHCMIFTCIITLNLFNLNIIFCLHLLNYLLKFV